MAEEATGLREKAKGPIYLAAGSRAGETITAEEAREVLLSANGRVALPNAGAGTYEEFFESLGFDEVKSVNTSASSGDWTLAVHDADGWHMAYQNNRHPYHGFDYTIDTPLVFDTFEDLINSAAS